MSSCHYNQKNIDIGIIFDFFRGKSPILEHSFFETNQDSHLKLRRAIIIGTPTTKAITAVAINSFFIKVISEAI